MACRTIDDPIESGAGLVDGLGLLDADIVFEPDKTLRTCDLSLSGYEIHHGQVARSAAEDWLTAGIRVGIRCGSVFGTHWHGLLDNDALRRQWLTLAAAAAGRHGFVVADDVNVSMQRDAQLDLMADLLAEHLDVEAIMGLLDDGPPRRPRITSVVGDVSTP
jgi:adenosylcobyric acid synthase